MPLDTFITESSFTPTRFPLPILCGQATSLNRQIFLEYEATFANPNILTYGFDGALREKYCSDLSKFSSNACALSVEVELFNLEHYGFV